jgi:hypothetical protein
MRQPIGHLPQNFTHEVGTDTAINLSKIQHRLVRRFFLKVASKMVVFHLWMQLTKTHSNLQLGEMYNSQGCLPQSSF